MLTIYRIWGEGIDELIIRKEVLGDEAEQFKIIQLLLGLLNGYTCFRMDSSLALELDRDKEETINYEQIVRQRVVFGGDTDLLVN